MYVAKSGALKAKKGIWEDGQRIMWIDDPDTIQQIESGSLDYRSLMKNEENQNKPHVSDRANLFAKPEYLDDRIRNIEAGMKSKKEQHMKDVEYLNQKIQDVRSLQEDFNEQQARIKQSMK